MKLSTPGLQLELLPLRQADDEQWCRVQVRAAVRGFEANYEAWLQTADLELFKNEIAALYRDVGQPGVATLASAELDIKVTLTMQTLGGIEGSYRFQSEQRDGGATKLSGTFELDQSFLPELCASIDTLLNELQTKNAP